MLLRKMLRDMRHNKTQFLSIFLLTILGVFIYSGVTSEWYGARYNVNQYYKDTNLADAWIYGNGFSEDAAKEVSKIDGVIEVERRLTIEGVGEFDNHPTLKLHFVNENRINKFKVLEGEAFSLKKDGIWIDSLFAAAKKLKVGDKITVILNGYPLTKEIKGLIMSPEYVYFAGKDEIVPNRSNLGFGFISDQFFPKEIPINYPELLVKTNHLPADKLEKSIDQALRGKYSVFLPRKNLRSYMQFTEEIKEHKAMSEIFPITFLAVALLTIVTTMARLINNQRTQIGILKAIGFKRRRILFHYISYGLWISIVGTIVGVLVGPLTIPKLFYGPMHEIFIIPKWEARIPYSVVLMAFLSVFLCTLVTYLSCRNVLKDTPSESLRPKAPKSVKHSLFDRLSIWKKMSFNTQWNLRDVFRCKGRTLMAIVGVLGCSALLICGLSVKDTFNYVQEWNYKIINRYQTRLELEDTIKPEQINSLTEKYNGEKIQESTIELKANGNKRTGELLVTDQVSLIHFVDSKCKEIKLPKDKVSISYKMAELLGIGIGDKISWHIYGEEKWNTSIIGGIYRTPLSQGITMTKEVYENNSYPFLPSAIITNNKITADKENSEQGVVNTKSIEEMTKAYLNMSETMNILIYVLMIAAIVLAVVVIYNLGVLSFTERQRELSTLKVIGFKTKQLRTLLVTQNIWLTVVGIIPGIPIGLYMNSIIFRYLGDVFDFIQVVSIASYLLTIGITIITSFLVNLIFSRSVKKIDMVSSLKGVE